MRVFGDHLLAFKGNGCAHFIPQSTSYLVILCEAIFFIFFFLMCIRSSIAELLILSPLCSFLCFKRALKSIFQCQFVLSLLLQKLHSILFLFMPCLSESVFFLEECPWTLQNHRCAEANCTVENILYLIFQQSFLLTLWQKIIYRSENPTEVTCISGSTTITQTAEAWFTTSTCYIQWSTLQPWTSWFDIEECQESVRNARSPWPVRV